MKNFHTNWIIIGVGAIITMIGLYFAILNPKEAGAWIVVVGGFAWVAGAVLVKKGFFRRKK